MSPALNYTHIFFMIKNTHTNSISTALFQILYETINACTLLVHLILVPCLYIYKNSTKLWELIEDHGIHLINLSLSSSSTNQELINELAQETILKLNECLIIKDETNVKIMRKLFKKAAKLHSYIDWNKRSRRCHLQNKPLRSSPGFQCLCWLARQILK